ETRLVSMSRELESGGAPVEAILLEPEARNTSAAAALAAAWLEARGADERMLVMPSDHVIADADAFLAAVKTAIPHAENGAIVTFGARPTEPNTQVGYIAGNTARSCPDGSAPIARFVEKPNPQTAAEYVQSGHFFWNSGIFLMKSATLLDEMRQFLPDSLDAIVRSVREASLDGLFVRPGAEAFATAQNISIDHGVMDKTTRGVVVPVEMQWSDVGAWDAVWKLSAKDAAGNATSGDVVAVDTRDSLLRADGKAMVAAI